MLQCCPFDRLNSYAPNFCPVAKVGAWVGPPRIVTADWLLVAPHIVTVTNLGG